MNLQIKYEDKFNLEITLDMEFRQHHRNYTIPDLERIIKAYFSKAIAFFHLEESPDFKDVTLRLDIHSRSQKSNRLAYFDLRKLTKDSRIFSFKIYCDILINILKKENFNFLKIIFIHELAHLIDYKELLHNKAAFKKIPHIPVVLPFFEEKKVNPAKHLRFLQLILKYRTEGIATLIEFLAKDPDSALLSKDQSTAYFNKICKQAFRYSQIKIAQNNSDFFSFVEQTNSMAYRVGAAIVLTGLINKYPQDKAFVEILNCLNNKEFYTGEIDYNILEKIFHFKTFDFIYYYFDHDSIYSSIFTLTKEYGNSLDYSSEWVSELEKYSEEKNISGMLYLLGELIGSPMDKEEINQHHAASNKMPPEIKQLADILVQRFQQNPDDQLALWALTYLYDDEDMLDDNIDYFGYVDDLQILQAVINCTVE